MMAPTKKSSEANMAAPSAAGHNTTGPSNSGSPPQPSLSDTAFLQQLLQLAQQSAEALHGAGLASPREEDGAAQAENASDGVVSSRCTSPSLGAPSTTAGNGSIVAPSSLSASARGSPGSLHVGAHTDAELPPAVRLHALVATACGAGSSYWTDLRKQCEVDELVNVLHHCAAQGYSPLKTQHLLAWLRAFRTLVEGRRAVDDTVPARLMPHAGGAGEERDSAAVSGAAVDSAAARRQPRKGSAAPAAPASAGRRTSGGSSSAKGRRRSSAASDKRSSDSTTRASLTAATAADEVCTAAEEAAVAAQTPEPRVPYEEALRQALTSFLTSEVAMGWRWSQVPRQRPHPSSAGAAPSSGSAKKKPSRSERQRQQQLQQQELEEEQRRLAAAAALPPENIYLKADEVTAFVEPIVQRGLLQHAALYEYLATHPTQAPCPASAAMTLDLVVEPPVVPPPLHLAVRFMNDDTVASPTAAAAAAATAGSVEVGGGRTGNPPPPAHPTSNATKATTSGRGSTTASHNTTPRGGAGEEHRRMQDSNATPEPSAVPPPSTNTEPPLGRLRHAQQAELAALTQRHTDATAEAAQRAKTEETRQAMELTFADRAGTTKAVKDVYESLERELQQRQARILQRVTALEVSLGLRADPRAETAEAATPASEELARAASAGQSKSAAKRH